MMSLPVPNSGRCGRRVFDRRARSRRTTAHCARWQHLCHAWPHACLLWAPAVNLKRKRCAPANADAETCGCIAWRRLCLLASACSGFGTTIPGPACRASMTARTASSSARRRSSRCWRTRSAFGSRSGQPAGPCLRRAAVCVPQPQEGAHLRGAGAGPSRGRRVPKTMRGSQVRPVADTDLARYPIRCRGEQRARRRDEGAPLQGLERLTARPIAH